MKTKLLALALLAGSSMFAETRFSIGISIGGNAPGFYHPLPYQTAPLYAAPRGYDARYTRSIDRDDYNDNRGRVVIQKRLRDDDRGRRLDRDDRDNRFNRR